MDLRSSLNMLGALNRWIIGKRDFFKPNAKPERTKLRLSCRDVWCRMKRIPTGQEVDYLL